MPTSRSKKRSTRNAASKSEAKSSSPVVEIPDKDGVTTSEPDLCESEPDFSSPGSVLQIIFDSQRLKTNLARKKLKPPGLPRSLLFRSLPLPPSSFDCGNDNVYSGETLTAVPLQDKNVRELMEDITCDILKEKNAARPPPPISIGGSSSTQKAENALSAVSSIAVSYSCKECEYTSGRCNTLATHIVDTHQPEGVTAISLSHVCCGQTFVTRVELLNHVRYRHKSNCSNFACPMSNCDKAMSTPSLLERHIRERHENPILNCPFCDYTSKYKQNLRRHIRVHHEAESIFREQKRRDCNPDDKMDVDVDPISCVKTEIDDESGNSAEEAFHGFGEESSDKRTKGPANKTNEDTAIKNEPTDN